MKIFHKDLIPEPEVCGGSTTTFAKDAPTEITSREIVRLDCVSSFRTVASPDPKYRYIAAFAAKVDDGALAGYVCEVGFEEERESKLGVVSDAVFEKLIAIVDKYRFAADNGRNHSVNGLPENFGGHVSVDYASGEEIYFSDNQSPVMSGEAGAALVDCIKSALKKDAVKGLPSSKDVVSFHWEERSDDGGYHLIDWDGTALHTDQKYGFDGSVYVHDVTTAPEDFDKIRRMVDSNQLLFWGGLPEYNIDLYKRYKKTMTFRLKDGSERTVVDGMKGPDFARNGIFETEMYVGDVMRKYK